MLTFQNCSKVSFSAASESSKTAANGTDSDPDDNGTGTGGPGLPPGNPGVCNGISCELTPLTSKPAVTTILLALGDEANNQLVINGASSQLIAETVVRYSSPKSNPKILLVLDFNDNSESLSDREYVEKVLLARYDVTVVEDTTAGLTDADLNGFDLVWFNNPGHPMGSEATRDALIRFKGGVILQGDDLARGNGFSPEALTGLSFKDNGTEVVCGQTSYRIDNNTGEQYSVQIAAQKFTGSSQSSLSFKYGNDIDHTSIARSDLEILATAKGSPSGCTEEWPAIVRYTKN